MQTTTETICMTCKILFSRTKKKKKIVQNTDCWKFYIYMYPAYKLLRYTCMTHLITKPTKWHVRPVKIQISLGIRTVWSESSLFAHWELRTSAFFMRTAKTLIRLGGCSSWSASSLGAHAILLVLSCASSYNKHNVDWWWIPRLVDVPLCDPETFIWHETDHQNCYYNNNKNVYVSALLGKYEMNVKENMTWKLRKTWNENKRWCRYLQK